MSLSLRVCCWNYDRTRALIDGRVPIAGCAPSYVVLRPEEAFARAFGAAEFEVSELSLANQMAAIAEGRAAYRALPIFLSRAFRHGCLYVRDDRGIAAPRDLVGRRIGLQEYGMTAAVVVRGLLRDEYGVRPEDMQWWVGEVETPSDGRPHLPVPPRVDVRAVPFGASLDGLLAAGELDALLALNPPPCLRERRAPVRRLFPDWRQAEQDYVRRTGIFPIMHAVGIRADMLATHRWLVRALFEAFAEGKRLAIAELEVLQAPKVTLPWAAAELEATRALLGDDPWPYGLAGNRHVLETQIRWAHEDGLIPHRLDLEELFPVGPPGT